MNKSSVRKQLKSINYEIGKSERLLRGGFISKTRYDIRMLDCLNLYQSLILDIARSKGKTQRVEPLRCIRNTTTNVVLRRKVTGENPPKGWVFTTKGKFDSFVRNGR